PANEDAKPAEVGVAEGGIGIAKRAQDAEQEGGQDGDDQTVDEGTEHRTAATTGGIAVDTGGTAGKEVWHQSGQNQRDAEHGVKPYSKQCQAGQTTNEGGDKSDKHRILGIREDNRSVQCRNGTGDDLGGNALEG